MTQTSKWELDVAGMTCDGCGRHVTKALKSVGLEDVSVTWADGRAVFAAVTVDQEAVAAAVSAAGYRAGQLHAVSDPEVATDSGPDQAAAHGPKEAAVAGRPGAYDWDLAILGSGSAAFAAAIKASGKGARVVMVERETLGGTCVNIGCVPSKALLRAVELYHQAGHHDFAGVPHLAGQVDLAALVAQKDELVETLRQAKYLDLVDDYDFELVKGDASFVDEHTIDVDGSRVTAGSFLIATGAAPAVPPIEGLDGIDYLTSTTALSLEEIPESLAVIGANAIGLELGQLFAHLGTDVTFLDIADRIAPFEEPEVSAALTEVLTAEGSRVVTGARIDSVARDGNGYVLSGKLGDVDRLEVDQVLVATGRTPNTAGLNLSAVGVSTDARGFVVTDEHLATSASHIYAAGDVIATPQFVYVAAYEGALAADNLFGAIPRSTDYRTMPRITFTTPQIASVGLTEAQAVQAGLPVKTAVLPLEYVPRAIVNRETRGLIKLVADSSTDRLLGAHMIGDSAGDVMQAAVYALTADFTTEEMAAGFHGYLTMAEGLKLAAQTFDKDVSKLSCCAA